MRCFSSINSNVQIMDETPPGTRSEYLRPDEQLPILSIECMTCQK